MTRVLFVCLGNICRSPMAHGLFEHLVAERGLSDRYEVDSCGTAAAHVGERPDRRTLAVLDREGVALRHRARQLRAADYDRFDWILVMDPSNLRDANRVFGRSERESKARLVLEPLGRTEVPDPYYGGPQGFDEVYGLLDASLRLWLERMG